MALEKIIDNGKLKMREEIKKLGHGDTWRKKEKTQRKLCDEKRNRTRMLLHTRIKIYDNHRFLFLVKIKKKNDLC